jgi:hypothetical protein
MSDTQTTGALAGSYITRRHRLKYTYIASWSRSAAAVEWKVTVKRGEHAAIDVGGVVNPVERGAETWNVRHAIEAAIETGAELQDEA